MRGSNPRMTMGNSVKSGNRACRPEKTADCGVRRIVIEGQPVPRVAVQR